MLDRVLPFIKDALDAHLRRQLSFAESIVILNHIRGDDSGHSQKNQNRVVMTMTKLEYDNARKVYNLNDQGSSFARKDPPQYFNINILISSNFDDYNESLKILSRIVEFFQANSVFKREDHPHMPDGVNLLEVEVENSSDARSFEMWSALGAHYVPSIIYKIRRIVVDAGQIAGLATAMQRPVVGVGHE